MRKMSQRGEGTLGHAAGNWRSQCWVPDLTFYLEFFLQLSFSEFLPSHQLCFHCLVSEICCHVNAGQIRSTVSLQIGEFSCSWLNSADLGLPVHLQSAVGQLGSPAELGLDVFSIEPGSWLWPVQDGFC